MIRVAFLVRSLEYGGAERQVVTLSRALSPDHFAVTIVSFYGGGRLEKELKGSNVRLISLSKKGRWDLFGFLWRAARSFRSLQPDVIHGYLDIPNLLALAAKLLIPRARIIWGARASNVDLEQYDWLRRAGFRLERAFSGFADRIIVNSQAGRAHLVEHGFPASKIKVIQNGIDADLFRPDREARAGIRAQLGITEDQILIGIVGRLDPMKDHLTFLRAASLLSAARDDVRFACIGDGAPAFAAQLRKAAEELGLARNLLWLGARSDMPAVYNALDINVSSSSSGEGFSNATAEAMAAGVPCVVADTGDSALIVGDTGVVVPPRNPEALAAALRSCIERNLRELGARARQRIQENWSIQRLAQETERVITAVCGLG